MREENRPGGEERLVEVRNDSPLELDTGAVAGLALAVLAREECDTGVAVTFVTEEVMARLNREYRGTDGPTDVLAFPLSAQDEEAWPEPEEAEAQLGDVVICPYVAVLNAGEHGVSPSEEITNLIVHGVLHLLGWDHERDEGEMGAREIELRKELASMLPQVVILEEI